MGGAAAIMGVDMKKITSPLVLVSKDEFEITFSDVRVIANASEDNTIQLCDSEVATLLQD